MSKQQLKQITNKFGKFIPWAKEPEEGEIDPDQPFQVPNRAEKRQRYGERSTPKGAGKIHDVLRRGHGRRRPKTGQPQWFKVMKYEAARRKVLEKVRLDRLEPAVGQIAVDLYYGGYRNVWQVSQVEDINELLRVGRHGASYMGVRSRELKKLRDYLVAQRVPVKWEV